MLDYVKEVKERTNPKKDIRMHFYICLLGLVVVGIVCAILAWLTTPDIIGILCAIIFGFVLLVVIMIWSLVCLAMGIDSIRIIIKYHIKNALYYVMAILMTGCGVTIIVWFIYNCAK